MKPSLHDVARKAGVSAASVSRVLNRVNPTSERLRGRVQAAVDELGYVPKNAQGPEPGKLLCVIAYDLRNPYFCEIITGIQDRAAVFGLTPMIVDLQGGHAGWESVRAAAAGIGCKGHLFLGTGVAEHDLAAFAEQAGTPVVAVNQAIRHPSIRTINIDYVKATGAATQHLLRLGHRRIGFLGGSPSSPVSVEKVRGVQMALAEAGLELPPANVIYGAATVEWGFQAMNSLLARPPEARPTAILCACDLIALGVLHALRSAQLSVPGDVSVVGFDDIDMACHSNPPLTTISPPKYDMGRTAVDQVLARDPQSSTITEYVMIESPLVVRESTGACP
jgi:LacI family transcriptional regulator